MRIANTKATLKKNLHRDWLTSLMLPSLMAVRSSESFTGLTGELCETWIASSLGRLKGVIYTWYSTITMILASRAEHD